MQHQQAEETIMKNCKMGFTRRLGNAKRATITHSDWRGTTMIARKSNRLVRVALKKKFARLGYQF